MLLTLFKAMVVSQVATIMGIFGAGLQSRR